MTLLPPQAGAVPGHVGYVAGRYRNGAASDQWTDVRRCADATFTSYAAACSCGWRGPWAASDAVGLVTARRQWSTEHLTRILQGPRGEPASAGTNA